MDAKLGEMEFPFRKPSVRAQVTSTTALMGVFWREDRMRTVSLLGTEWKRGADTAMTDAELTRRRRDGNSRFP